MFGAVNGGFILGFLVGTRNDGFLLISDEAWCSKSHN